jgi:hypothetical protein
MKADLPIVQRKGTAVLAAFPCALRVLRPLLPHPVLAPASLGFGRGVCVVAVLDHEDTSIGPYREVRVGFPCRLRRSGPLPLIPLLGERFFEDVGTWVQVMPVSTPAAAELARSAWGFPAFVADIRIERSGDRLDCEVIEDGRRVLHVAADRPGNTAPGALPVRLYSALNDEILFTEAHVDARIATARIGARARLELADHPRTRDLDRDALAKAGPLEVRWLDEHRTMLDRPAIRYRMSA